MALEVWEGFDHYNNSADLFARSGFLQWTAPVGPGGSVIGIAIPGRNGYGKALSIQNGIAGSFAVRNQEFFIGQAVCIPANTQWIYQLNDSVGAAVQLEFLFTALNCGVTVRRGGALNNPLQTGTLIAASANNVWATNAWNYIEVWVKIDDTTGFVQIKNNGVVILNATGLDTQNTGNSWADIFSMFGLAVGGGGSALVYFDDWYYGDTTTGPGAPPCDEPIGDVQVRTLFATGDGAVQWTPLTGSDNYAMINETAMDSDTTYNYTSTPGDKDRFTFQPLQNTVTTVYGVQTTGAYRKDDAGTRIINQAVVSNSVEALGPDHSLPSNYVYFTDPFILNPDTGVNWTLSDINAMLAGYDLVS